MHRSIVIAAWLAAAGDAYAAPSVGADAPAPTSAAPLARAADTSPAWDRPILADPNARPKSQQAPRHFEDHGVGPTIDTAERPRVAFALSSDSASFALASGALARGHLPHPAEVRVESFVGVFARAPSAPAELPPGELRISFDAVRADQRRGYQLLRVTAYAHPAPPRPVDVVVALDLSQYASTPELIQDARNTVAALCGGLTRDDRIAVVSLSAPTRVLVPLGAPPSIGALAATLSRVQPSDSPPLAEAAVARAYRVLDSPRDNGRQRAVVVVGNGNVPVGRSPRSAIWSLARRHAQSGVYTFAVGLGNAHYNDVLLGGLANAGRGAYMFAHEPSDTGRQLAQQLHEPVVALDPTLEVEFDPAAVTRYRLLGFESRIEPAPVRREQASAGAMRAGAAVTALYEVRLREGRRAIWGEARLRHVDPVSGKARVQIQALTGLAPERKLARAHPNTQLVVLAAAVAEKLRASYWARRVEWTQLRARARALPDSVRAQPDVQRLLALIDRASKLDVRARLSDERSDATREVLRTRAIVR